MILRFNTFPSANNKNIKLPNDNYDTKTKILAHISWKDGKNYIRKSLYPGKYFIGNGPAAHIQIPNSQANICGYLFLDENNMFIKCTSASPVMYVDSKKMKVGDVVHIGDVLELTVGRTTLNIATHNPYENQKHEKINIQQEKINTDKIDDNIEIAIASANLLRQQIAKKLLDELNLTDYDLDKLETPEVRETARLKLRKIIAEINLPQNYPLSKEELEKQIFDEIVGLGPLEPLLADETTTEIMVNRKDQIFLEKGGKILESPIHFSSDQALLHVIERIVSKVGRRIDQSCPVVDARLLDGSRVNAVIPPIAIKGPCLTIRRFSKKPISMKNLIEWGSLSYEMSEFLKHMVLERKNIVISGGTGSGKTTLLNALSNFIPADERIITVEDSAELQLQQEHVISLETRMPNLEGKGAITIRDLVKNTLRMRPDRIVVGECRGAEALDMLQAMNTGHDGSMTTAHANSPEDMLRRLETMVMMAGMELSLNAIREQIASAIDIIVQLIRNKQGKRQVINISWIRSVNQKTYTYELYPLFLRKKSGELYYSKKYLTQFHEEHELSFDLNNFLDSVAKTHKPLE